MRNDFVSIPNSYVLGDTCMNLKAMSGSKVWRIAFLSYVSIHRSIYYESYYT